MVKVDTAPTAIQAAKAERELAQLVTLWDAVKTGQLTPLNTALTQLGLPAIQPELHQEDDDEE